MLCIYIYICIYMCIYIIIYVYINPYDVLRQINHQWIHKCGSWPIDREDTETKLSIGSYAKVLTD